MLPFNQTRDFFSALSPELHTVLEKVSHGRRAEAGEVLLHEGGRWMELYQLHSGQVEYRMADGRGGTAAAAKMGKGDWIGLPEVLSGLPASADVIALTPAELRIIPRHEFEALLECHPALSRRLLQLLSASVSSAQHQARHPTALPLRDRILRALYTLSITHGKTLRQEGILIEMSQEELSRRLAAARQTLNRQLKLLEREGLIRLNYGSITVLGLHRLAERQSAPDFCAPPK